MMRNCFLKVLVPVTALYCTEAGKARIGYRLFYIVYHAVLYRFI